MKVQRIAAIVLLAMFAVRFLPAPEPPLLHVWPSWVGWLRAAFAGTLALAAAMGLARSWWWARMLTVSLALAVLYPAIISPEYAVPLHLSY